MGDPHLATTLLGHEALLSGNLGFSMVFPMVFPMGFPMGSHGFPI